KLAKAFEDSLGNNPLAKLAEQNMAMFRAASAAFMPGAEKGEGKPPAATPAPSDPGDLSALRDQMAEIQKRLDALGK
ncbi:MAG TPA: polyhydroxyalkanoate synthesis repressor PhaR, partial [Novosphingobium sp.]|nr:polyhydroxyalkanoate synthesis repressor PhaR [Novosphingobium sp.]